MPAKARSRTPAGAVCAISGSTEDDPTRITRTTSIIHLVTVLTVAVSSLALGRKSVIGRRWLRVSRG
jgi:hypothetical protein